MEKSELYAKNSYLSLMKFLTLLFGLLCAVHSFGQFIPINLKIDAAVGTHYMHSQKTKGYEIEKLVPYAYVGGLRYALTRSFHLRGEVAVNLNRPATGSNYFRNDYFRTTIGVSTDLLHMDFMKTQGQKNAARIGREKFKLYGFVGFGVSAMINKMRFESDYNRRIYVYDYMANFCASIIPTFRFNPYHAIFISTSMIGHIRQAYNFDLMGGNDNRGFDGGYMTTVLGYSYTPFRSMSGMRNVF